MKKLAMALAALTGFGAVSHSAEQPVELFRASFDKAIEADFAKGSKAPAETAKLKLVPGVKGDGVLIPADGSLNFLTQDNVRMEAGSVSMWVKLNWRPVGTGLFVDRPGPGEKYWKFIHTMFSASPTLNPNTLSTEPAVNVLNRIYDGDWIHLAATWDEPSKRIEVYVDGVLVSVKGYFPMKLDKLLKIGSATNSQEGLDGVVDELRVFDRALTEAEVAKLRSELFPVSAVLLDYAGTAGNSGESFRVRFVNTTDSAVEKVFDASVSDSSGKVLKESRFKVSLKPRESAVESLDFAPPAEGDYRVSFKVDGLQQKTNELTAISPKSVSASMPSSQDGAVKMKLVEEIDCSKDAPESKYRDDGACHVVKSPAGDYRETSMKGQSSGFAYRMEVKSLGKPHWLEIEYPDDASRIFSVAVFPRCDINFKRLFPGGNLDDVGVMTGGFHPLTGAMQTKRFLFWPDSTEFMVLCASWVKDGRAALSKIRLYENDGPLPKLEVNYPDGPRRDLGIWQEDPSMESSNWFNRPECYKRNDFAFWKAKAGRMVEYFRFTGKTAWSFLLFDYNGDNSGALAYELPPSDWIAMSTRINGWADLIAATFDREEIPFFIEINHRFNGRYSFHNNSLGKIVGFENLSYSFDYAQSKGDDALEDFASNDSLASGNYGLNPLHPKVQEAYLKIFRAYREKFGRYKQFKGINLISPIQIAFERGLDSGYSDYNIHLFERETGISIPVPNDSKSRFSKRCAWLKQNALEKWISWRCEKVRDFHVRLLKELNSDGLSGLKLMIRVKPEEKVQGELAKGRASSEVAQSFRERGVDLALLSQVEGLVAMPEIEPNMSRTTDHPDQQYYCFSPELAKAFEGVKSPALVIQHHSNLECWKGDSNKINSFWWPAGCCIFNDNTLTHYSTPMPDNKFAMENMAWALAEVDPQFIDHGWWGCPENGDYEDYQRFYKAYLSIPAVPFEKIPGVNDPVVFRVHNAKSSFFGLFGGSEGDWLYLVNKSWQPVKVSFSLEDGPSSLLSAVDGKDIPLVGGKLSRELKGFEVLVLKSSGRISVRDIVQEPSAESRSSLSAKLSYWERRIAMGKKLFGVEDPASRQTLDMAKEFFAAGKLTLAERRLQSDSLLKLEKSLACDLRARLSLDGRVSVKFVNTGDDEVSGSVKLLDWPKWTKMQPAGMEGSFSKLKPGEAFDAVFEFKGPGFPERLEQDFKFELSLDGRSPFVKTVKIAPMLSLKASPGKDSSAWGPADAWYYIDSKDNILCGKSDDPRRSHEFKHYKASLASRWSQDGLALTVVVEDGDLITPAYEGSMYSEDSLQVYFDQGNSKAQEYDENDLIYQIGLVNGRGKAWREQTPSELPKGLAKDVKVSVKRQEGKTCYEILFPASEFTRVKLESGAMLGFSIQVNNRDKASYGTVHSKISTSASPPYLSPWAWRDLILSDRSERKDAPAKD